MRAYLLLVALSIPAAATAFQCGSFNVSLSRYHSTINGDPVKVASKHFTAAPGDYSNSIITLKPDNITINDQMYRITTVSGFSTLELLTTESPPRVLNRGECGSTQGPQQ